METVFRENLQNIYNICPTNLHAFLVIFERCLSRPFEVRSKGIYGFFFRIFYVASVSCAAKISTIYW